MTSLAMQESSQRLIALKSFFFCALGAVAIVFAGMGTGAWLLNLPGPGSLIIEASNAATTSPSTVEELNPTATSSSITEESTATSSSTALVTTEKVATDGDRIAELLHFADTALAELRLTLPADDNALSYYQAILALDPANPKAKAGLGQIASRYGQLGRSQASKGNYSKARTYVNRGLEVDPGNTMLLALKEDIAEQQTATNQQTTQVGSQETGTTSQETGKPSHDDGTMVEGDTPAELLNRFTGLFD